MGTPLGPKYIPYTYMDPLGTYLILKILHDPGIIQKPLFPRFRVFRVMQDV